MVAPSLLTPTNETWREGELMTWHWVEVANAIFLLVFGVFGNTLVLHVYNFRLPVSTITYMKSTLAVLDLSAIVITKTLFFYMHLNPNSHLYDAICVFAAFFSIWNTGCADLILVVIAVDRFRRLCLVPKAGVHTRSARRLFLAIFMFSWLLNVPIFWLFGKSVRYVPEYGVKVTHCFLRDDQVNSTLFYTYYVILLIFFLVTSLTLCIIYFKIVQRLKYHTSVQDRLYSPTPAPQPEMTARSSTKDAMKNSIMAFAIITVLYLFTSCFFMVVMSSYAFGRGLEHPTTPRMQAIHDLAKQGPMYGRIINPIVYSFTSPVFRKEAYRLLLCEASETLTGSYESKSGSRAR